MRIFGPPTANLGVLDARLSAMTDLHARFRTDMLTPLYAEAVRRFIDPVGMVAQAYKETGGGRFGGKVKPEFYNPCGLKVRHTGLFPGVTDGDNPLAHQMFPSWTIGCRAMAQHLCAYAGLETPDEDLVDPRYFLVFGKHRCETFEDLGGKWAPSLAYGAEVVILAGRILGTTT